MNNTYLSIIVCTFNRSKILALTLPYLSEQSRGFDSMEIIVIDNNSIDDTKDVIQEVQKKDPRIKYIHEIKQGLSFARNRGLEEASADWLLYLDDDAKLSQNNLEHVFHTIETYAFSMFTGVWKEWHLSTPPIWLPYSTGNYILRGSNTIREIGDDYITGLIMLINKQKLLEIGGFPTNLGMKGNKVAYGEETYVEQEFKKRGWKVGINPNIVIDHLVGEHKYKLSWHLEAAFAKGRDTQLIKRTIGRGGAKLGLLKSILFGWVKPLLKLILRSEYYRQNFIIDYVGAIRYYQGVLVTFDE